jgi:starch phosphorylase
MSERLEGLPAAAEEGRLDVASELRYSVGAQASDHPDPYEMFRATSLALRRVLIDRAERTQRRHRTSGAKRVYYLSMEFLIGQSLRNNAMNLGMAAACDAALDGTGYRFEDVAGGEPDAALGNGGLGRLAACFVDSMATLGVAGTGCGLRYDFGLFKQEIIQGEQRENPDNWKADSSPWLIERGTETHQIPLFGHIEHMQDADGAYLPMWLGWKSVIGVPYDMPIVGHQGKTVNYLRLYAARSSESFDMQIFNSGDFVKAVEQKVASETISKVLYPTDAVDSGRELRLIQEYFLVACSLRDALRDFDAQGCAVHDLPIKVAIQMNDTHPALAVAELMRILVDERRLDWEDAWEISTATLAYTNHTLMPEALEKWPVDLFERVLPRHTQIIYEINRRFLDTVRARWPGDDDACKELSLIEEGHTRKVRMANLAIVGSHSVNGVAALHTRLIASHLVPRFHQLWPEKFNNKTNGVTPRRWLHQANPGLAGLLTEALGGGWPGKLDQLRGLERFADDASFLERLGSIKRENKRRLANQLVRDFHMAVDPDSMFDVQCKRMHEYKRQLLHVLHAIHLYLQIVEDGRSVAPRTHIFSGKAAPGYFMAKRIIHLINAVADTVQRDPRASGKMAVVFMPDYRVSVAETLIPAADLSEQISTAGLEASGTGNMKFAMNGALTVGTWDGANIEMAQEIGERDMYIFGLRAEEVEAAKPSYRPRSIYEGDWRIRRVLDAIVSGRFGGDGEAFRPIVDSLLNHDTYFVLADFDAYLQAHAVASAEYEDPKIWNAKALRNIAGMGFFSSDRTIREYCRDIWGIQCEV